MHGVKRLLLFTVFISIIILFIAVYRYLNPKPSPVVVNQNIPTQELQTNVPYRIETIAEGLTVPWSIVETEQNRFLVTERPGRIRVIQNGTLEQSPLITFPEISSNAEEGLMGLTIDPDYRTNAYLYTAFAYTSQQGMFVKVVRLVDKKTHIERDKTIIDLLPAAQFHAGTGLAFGPDKKLYITTGDATKKNIAQDKTSLGGKILRLHADGSIPEDNPFPDSPVYALGFRNSQGLDWNKEGSLFAVDHGPSTFDGPPGGDEINNVIAGGNYGWPIVSHEKSRDGLVSPIQVYTPAIAPASLIVYTGTLFPQFENSLLVTGLRGTGIYHIQIDPLDSTKVLYSSKIEDIQFGRIRAITEAKDGTIYFSTSNKDGRGKPDSSDDRILRLVPVDSK